jgi:hypothetical protein
MSQKELEKVLHENIDPVEIPKLHKSKARIEVIVHLSRSARQRCP